MKRDFDHVQRQRPVVGRHHLRAHTERAGCTWPPSSTRSAAAWWAGRMADHLRTELALAALTHGADGATARAESLIHHSDRGCQYTAPPTPRRWRSRARVPQHGPTGNLLGQRRGRELLRHPEDRTAPPPPLAHPSGGPGTRSSSTSRASTIAPGSHSGARLISVPSPSRGASLTAPWPLNQPVHQTEVASYWPCRGFRAEEEGFEPSRGFKGP